jgi:hypothetical protein
MARALLWKLLTFSAAARSRLNTVPTKGPRDRMRPSSQWKPGDESLTLGRPTGVRAERQDERGTRES